MTSTPSDPAIVTGSAPVSPAVAAIAESGGASTDTDAASSCQLEALLKVSSMLAVQQDFASLLDALATLLHEVVAYDFIVLLLYDSDAGEAWVYYPGFCADRIVKADTYPFVHGPSFDVWRTQRPLVKSIEDMEREYPAITPKRRSQKVASTCTVPLTTVHRRLGALEFASSQEGTYSSPRVVSFIQLVSAQVATAVDNALNYERARSSEASLARERDHLKTLLQVTNTVVSKLNVTELMHEIGTQISRVLGAEFSGLLLYDRHADQLRWEATHCPGGRSLIQPGRIVSRSGTVIGRAFWSGSPRLVSLQEMDALAPAMTW